MKKFVIITAVTLFFMVGEGCSQDLNPAEQNQNMQSIVSGSAVFRGIDNRYSGVRGRITLLETFVPGRMRMSNGTMIVHDKMNYDDYNDELIVAHRNNEVVVNASMIRYFILKTPDGDTLKFVRMPGPDSRETYFQVLVESEGVDLVKKNSKKLIEPDYRGAYSTGRDYSEFVPEQKYFVLQPGKALKEFKNKKTFLALFPGQQDALQQFIKSKKIDFQKEHDLKILMMHLNQLITN